MDMPEIWLPYGEVEVVLATGSENLGSIVESKLSGISQQEINLKPYKNIIIDGRDMSKVVLQKYLGTVSAQADSSTPAIRTVTVDGVDVNIPPNLSDNTLLVGTTRVDPMYGFLGPHSLVAKELGLDMEVWRRKDGGLHAVNEDNGVWFSKRLLESCDADALFYFDLTKPPIYGQALKVYEELLNIYKVNNLPQKQSKFTIISAGGSPHDDTLSDALAVAHSIIGYLAEDSELIIVAQMKDGLGSPALRGLVEGKKFKTATGEQYRSGVEGVAALVELKATAKVHLVSALPSAYADRLGVRLFSSLRDAFKAVQEAHKGRFKANIIKNASIYHSKKLVQEASGTV